MFNFILATSNLSLFLSFLIGFGIGALAVALIYLLFVVSTINKRNHIVKTQAQDVSDTEILKMISDTQEAFKDKNLKKDQSNIAYCKDLCVDLVINIASKFFPKSKHPLFELSVDEVLMLTEYISKRLDEILDYKGLRIFRGVKVTSIIGLTEVKQSIEANSIVKATKKYKIMEAFNAAKKVINIVNPVYWGRKIFSQTILQLVIKKLCLVLISIVGEETYKIYSKSVFNIDAQIDSGVSKLVDDINEQLVEDERLANNEDDSNNEEEFSKTETIMLEAPKNDEITTSVKKKKKFSIFGRHKEE